uniref:Uncharacterized protein n=1 Tax=Rhizophora mucronata TaxID=61149 RepID=A0A2P2QQK1_RHIMU
MNRASWNPQKKFLFEIFGF